MTNNFTDSTIMNSSHDDQFDNSQSTRNLATSSGTVTLKPKRDKPVRQRHPWIFSGAIQKISPGAVDGEVVDVTDHKGHWLCCGLLNRSSQIQVRILSWNKGEIIDNAFWRKRLSNAISLRGQYVVDHRPDQDAEHGVEERKTAVRLVHAESDYLPGLTVDQYGDYLAIQIGSLGIEKRKTELAHLLLELTGCKGVIDRSDGKQRRKERIPPLLDTLVAGETPPALISIEENDLTFQVDLLEGQKTGFYLDQRENRQRVAAYCRDKHVVNAFSYTGAFSACALAAGAKSVLNLDTSNKALTEGEENLRINGFDPQVHSESLAGMFLKYFVSGEMKCKSKVRPSRILM